MPLTGYLLTALLSYLLGSLPTGYLVAKARGVDIRTVGSGNIGATNVFRILGKPAGIFVLLVDALKGWLAVHIVTRLAAGWFGATGLTGPSLEWLGLTAGTAAILGHNYTCWLKFRGGKGIATSAGVLAALVPWALLIILSIWIIVFALSRYVSLASIAAAFSLPFATWLTGGSLTLILVTAALAVLAIGKHKTNIERLLSGTERPLSAKNKEATS